MELIGFNDSVPVQQGYWDVDTISGVWKKSVSAMAVLTVDELGYGLSHLPVGAEHSIAWALEESSVVMEVYSIQSSKVQTNEGH